jgi:hypothetical protein
VIEFPISQVDPNETIEWADDAFEQAAFMFAASYDTVLAASMPAASYDAVPAVASYDAVPAVASYDAVPAAASITSTFTNRF